MNGDKAWTKAKAAITVSKRVNFYMNNSSDWSWFPKKLLIKAVNYNIHISLTFSARLIQPLMMVFDEFVKDILEILTCSLLRRSSQMVLEWLVNNWWILTDLNKVMNTYRNRIKNIIVHEIISSFFSIQVWGKTKERSGKREERSKEMQLERSTNVNHN